LSLLSPQAEAAFYQGHRKGQQKTTIEHVRVHSDGQAIVGTVEGPTPVNSPRDENQHDARQINTPQPTLRSPDKERQLVPGASDAERPLPYARRKIARRSEGPEGVLSCSSA
jgi:hypothetical protein